MAASCPNCHIAVLPGYTRCPKCQHLLAVAPSGRLPTQYGGTVAQQRSFPIVPIAVGSAVALTIIIFFATRGGPRPVEPVEPPAAVAPVEVAPVAPTPIAVAPKAAAPTPMLAPEGPSPSTAGQELEKVLRRQRLWSAVTIRGERVDVRSSTCGDPAMPGAIEQARAGLRAAGLTNLRCLEESGRVVFERAL